MTERYGKGQGKDRVLVALFVAQKFFFHASTNVSFATRKTSATEIAANKK